MENASNYMSKAGEYMDKLGNLLIVWGPKLLLAIVLLVAGIIVINRLVKFMRRVMASRNPCALPHQVCRDHSQGHAYH